jgi:hypothetical protein
MLETLHQNINECIKWFNISEDKLKWLIPLIRNEFNDNDLSAGKKDVERSIYNMIYFCAVLETRFLEVVIVNQPVFHICEMDFFNNINFQSSQSISSSSRCVNIETYKTHGRISDISYRYQSVGVEEIVRIINDKSLNCDKLYIYSLCETYLDYVNNEEIIINKFKLL